MSRAMSRLWIATLLAALGLATLPVAAPATPTSPLSAPVGLAFFDEEEEGEFEEECFEEELEAPCEEEAEEAQEDDPGAIECPLRSTNAHAAVVNERLRVTVGYTTWRPTTAMIQVGRGATGLGTFKRRLGRSGVLRFAGKLGKRHGKKLVVSVRVPAAGRYCADDAAVLFK